MGKSQKESHTNMAIFELHVFSFFLIQIVEKKMGVPKKLFWGSESSGFPKVGDFPDLQKVGDFQKVDDFYKILEFPRNCADVWHWVILVVPR